MWSMDSQTELGRLVGHDRKIAAVAARGNLAVSSQGGGPPRLWNLEAMQCTATLPDMPGVPDTYSACCMEGKVLLGSDDGPIKLWDIATSAPVALPDLEGHTDAIFDIKVSMSMVLSGSADDLVRLWDLRTGKCVRTMAGHRGGVPSVDMDTHCRTAVSGGGKGDTTVRLWDLGSGRCSAAYEGHSSEVRDVVLHESGSSFLSSGDDHIVNAWAVGSSKANMRADFTSLLGNKTSRLFASKDLSKVAYCCINTGRKKLELRLWR